MRLAAVLFNGFSDFDLAGYHVSPSFLAVRSVKTAFLASFFE
jgi:hypothetical protein